MTQLKTIRHLGKETGTWTLNQNKEKKSMCSFSKHSKTCIIQIKKKNEPFVYEKRNINNLVLSLCFSESYSQPGSMSEPENIAIFVYLTLLKNSKKEVVIKNKIKRVDIDKNFDNILNKIYDTSLIDIKSIFFFF